MMTNGKSLRDLFNKEGIIRIVGAYDGISAKLVELNNFDGIWAGCFEISASCGVPVDVLNVTQHLQALSAIKDVVSIPVIADCNIGFGNSNNIYYTVKKYEKAGISAIVMEDRKYPMSNYIGTDHQELVPINEFLNKLLAAKKAQKGIEFMVIAKVDSLIAGWSQDDALDRAYAYVDAGADAIIINSKSNRLDDNSNKSDYKSNRSEDILEFTKSWDFSVPLAVIPNSITTLEKLNQMGIKMVIYPNTLLRASTKAINEILFDLKQDLNTVNDKIVSLEYIFEIHSMTESDDLKLEEEHIKVIIPAAGSPHNQESLEPILQDKPIAMLDIWGKSILQRNIETLNKSKLHDIFVIKGYKGDSFTVDDVTYIDNLKYQSEHILSSIMCAETKMNSKTLIIYSDIIFENHLIDRLKSLHSDFIIVVDNSFKTSLMRNKKLELVVTEESLYSGNRILNGRLYKVKKIGDILLTDNSSEFIGMCMLSKRGIDIFKKVYNDAMIEYANKPFYRSKNIFHASLTDILQHLIYLGYKIEAMQINSGWMEIHTFDNYKYACSILK